MRVASFASEVSFFNIFLGIVPSSSAGSHGDSDKKSGDDGTDEKTAERDWPEQKTYQYRYNNRNQSRKNHLLYGSSRHDVHACTVFGFARAFHDALDFAELSAHFLHYFTGGLTHGFHAKRAEVIWQETSDK